MPMMSAPIDVADATAYKFVFRVERVSANVQVRFFTDAAGLVELSPLGTGSRDITATNSSSAFEGSFTSPGQVLNFESNLENGTIAALPDGKWDELSFGVGMQNVTISAAANTTPGTAATYRIIVDGAGSSGPA